MSKPVAKIKIIDEVNAVVQGLASEHVLYFYEEYGREAENYFFNPKFKLGTWDGKIRYFNKAGKTHVYLLNDIVPRLVRLGYKIELTDNRTNAVVQPPLIDKDFFSNISDPETGEPIQMRPYQVDAVNAMISAGGGILIAGTGAGKTIMNAALAESYGRLGVRTITIVPSQDLVFQTREDFLYWGLDAGEYSGDVKDTDHLHVVSTWQALQNNKQIIKNFDLVIVDECQGIKGQVLTSILNEYGHKIAYRFGLTGTLPKGQTDAMAVRIAVGDIKYEIPAAELIRQGWLAKLDIDIMQLEENFEAEFKRFKEDSARDPVAAKTAAKMTYTKFKDAYFPDYQAEKSYLQSNKDRINWIAALLEVRRDMKKGNVFCLVDGVAFGKKLAKAIPGAIFVHGKDKKKARKEIYDLFKTHDNLVVIATVHIASTGLNIKRIFNLIFVDVGKSFVRVIQTIGRGLRKAPDKDRVKVIDVCSDLKYGKKHVRERIKYYNEAEYPHQKTLVKYKSVDLFE